MKYVPALDGLRAAAAFMVLAFHAKVPGFRGGYFGVDVFFVLSGFLITRLLIDQHRAGGIDLIQFYSRRLKRLYPAMLLVVGAVLLLGPTLYPQVERLGLEALLSALYVSDYAPMFGFTPEVLRHTWSLAIEEQFYLLWPLLLIGVLRLPRPVVALCLLYVAATAWRLYVASDGDHWRVYPRFDTHASGLVLGCLLAVAKVKLSPRLAWVGFAGLLALIPLFKAGSMETVLIGFTLAEVFAAILVLTQPPSLATPGLPWLGKMSYGVYLWHYPIMFWMRGHEWPWFATLVVGGALALGLAALSYYTIESVFRHRKPVAQTLTAP